MTAEFVSPEFISEALDIVDNLNRDVIAAEAAARTPQGAPPALINNLFRYAHTLKGIAGMCELQTLTSLSHALEGMLDGMRLGRVPLDAEALDLLFACIERFAALISQASRQEDAMGIDDLVPRLLAIMTRKVSSTGSPEAEILSPAVLAVLTEYEEHRLNENIRSGNTLYLLRTMFELTTFDVGLAELDAIIQAEGEVITKLPSAKESAPGHICFDIVLGTTQPLATLRQKINDERVEIVLLKGQTATTATPVAVPTVVPSAPAHAPAGHKDFDASMLAVPSTKERTDEAPAMASLKSVSQTVRVDIRRLDLLMNLVGELSLTKLAVQRISEDLRRTQGFVGMAVELHKESRSFERRLAELQAGIMEVRMVPLSNLFERMVRAGRKMARELGRELRIEVSGETTELDKLIVEDLSDPLMHLIRNAIDHGIEVPESRRGRGKAAEGVVRLKAIAQGNHVVVQVSDDGNGIDSDKVLATAVKRGQVAPERVQELSRRDIFSLLFAPGFSTRVDVSEYSGRGVGLDVVKTNIARLSGVIEVDSVPGSGTTFTVTLPITLAIISALIVRVAHITYAVPLNNVLETVSLKACDIETIEGREVISLRGTTLPLVDLREVFNFTDKARGDHGFAVVTGAGHTRMALLVDDMVGQQDIVIKSLGKRLKEVPGIAGATELGNQKTILVIDTMGLLIGTDAHSDRALEAS